MPFKSEAQRRKFSELVKQKKMSQETFDEWAKATRGHIPERVSKPAATKGRKSLLRRRHNPV